MLGADLTGLLEGGRGQRVMGQRADLAAQAVGGLEQRLAGGRRKLGFATPAEAAALAGLAPYACDSGGHHGRRRIRGGRQHPRKLLYLAASSAIRRDPALQAFYTHSTSRGKPREVALVAVMRKLLALLGALLRDDRLWTPEAPPAGSPA